MASLGQQVISGAQQQAQDMGHTVGDAMGAYHIAATAEHARQELEMEKQKQDMAKATWATSQLSAIARMPEATRKIAADSFVKQAQTVYPEMSPDIGDAIAKDADFTKGLARTFALQHGQDPSVVSNAFGGDLTTLQSHITKTMEEESKVKAAQLGMANVRQQQLEEAKRQHGLAFSEKVINNPIIQAATKNTNSLIRSEDILKNPKLPVTANDFNLAYQDYSNAVSQGGAATEGQIQRDLPESVTLEMNNLIKKYAGTSQDLRQTKAGKDLIDQLSGRITNVKEALGNAAGQQAEVFHSMAATSGNPYVADAAKGILKQYSPKTYAQTYGGNQVSAAAPASAPVASPSAASPDAVTAQPDVGMATPPAAPQPKPEQGAVQYNPDDGKTYKVIGDHWVEQ